MFWVVVVFVVVVVVLYYYLLILFTVLGVSGMTFLQSNEEAVPTPNCVWAWQ